MEVAAHTVLHARWTDEEKNALLRREDKSWVGLYQEFLSVFRLPLQFDKLIGECNYVDSTDKTTVDYLGILSATAICNNTMRAGKHYVSFQVNDDDSNRPRFAISCGIMRPTTKDITSLECCHPGVDDLSSFSLKDYKSLHNDNVDCCLMDTFTGRGVTRERWKKWKLSELNAMNEEQYFRAVKQNQCCSFLNWEGRGQIPDTPFKIGMVLDLDEGTLDVYDTDRRLGTMKNGLVGEYCWVVTFESTNTAKVLVSIGR